MNKKTTLLLKIGAAILILCAVVALCVIFIPMISSLTDEQTRDSFAEFIDSLGFFGILVMFALQVLQIIIAVIPGEPIELLMGLMYGTVGGMILTLLGIAVGQTIVFFLIKRFGISFAKKFVNVKKFEELSFIKNASKRDSLIFILFFIPGTPKDVLTYFVGFTGIPFLRFVILSTVARIPSVITSTWAGASISDGDLTKSIIIFAATGVLGLAGIFINNKIKSVKAAEKTDFKENTDD